MAIQNPLLSMNTATDQGHSSQTTLLTNNSDPLYYVVHSQLLNHYMNYKPVFILYLNFSIIYFNNHIIDVLYLL